MRNSTNVHISKNVWNRYDPDWTWCRLSLVSSINTAEINWRSADTRMKLWWATTRSLLISLESQKYDDEFSQYSRREREEQSFSKNEDCETRFQVDNAAWYLLIYIQTKKEFRTTQAGYLKIEDGWRRRQTKVQNTISSPGSTGHFYSSSPIDGQKIRRHRTRT